MRRGLMQGGVLLAAAAGASQAKAAVPDADALSPPWLHVQVAPVPKLAGGQGSLNTAKPLQTVGSYWPYDTTLFDYVRRAMPLNAPQTLDANQTYALAAFVLNLNGIVADDTELDEATLPAVRMPNRDGFIRMPNEPGR